MFSAPCTITFFHCTVYSILSSGFWGHLSVQASSPSWGWSGNFPSDCGIPLCLPLPPGIGVHVGYTGTVSPNIEWAESSCSHLVCNGMMHCPLLACQLHCMCHTFTTVLFSNAVDFCMAFHVGHQPADMCYLMVMLM